MLVSEACAQGCADLKYADIDTPALDASLLLAHVLNTSRESLLAKSKDILSEKNCAAYCGLIERRCSGECIAYIIGKKEFRGLEFAVNPSVLVPRPDTETLVEAAVHISGKIRILDLCTGSGAVAVALKNEKPEFEITAADISAGAIETAKKNAACLLPAGSQINFCIGDLFDALPSRDYLFDIIVSNPPYVSSDEIKTLSAEVQNEPVIALDGGADGLGIIKRIINKAPEYLQPEGMLLLEADPRQMREISALLENKGFTEIQFYNDLSGSQRVIGGIINS